MPGSPSKCVFLLLTSISREIAPRRWRAGDLSGLLGARFAFPHPAWHCPVSVLAGPQRLSAAARRLDGCPIIHCPVVAECRTCPHHWGRANRSRWLRQLHLTWAMHSILGWWPWPWSFSEAGREGSAELALPKASKHRNDVLGAFSLANL